MPTQRISAEQRAAIKSNEFHQLMYRCEWCGGKTKQIDRCTGREYFEIWVTGLADGTEAGLCIDCHEHYCRACDEVHSDKEWEALHGEE